MAALRPVTKRSPRLRASARAAVARRLAPALLALPLGAGPALALPAAAGGADPLALGATPLAGEELAELRGGFRIGGFDLAVGVVSRSVLAQSNGAGERLEVVSRYSVPGVGRLSHDGTSVQALPAAGGGAAPSPGIVITALSGGASVDLGGTTRLTQQLLNTFVENSDLNRTITRQLDVNLAVGGLARRLGAARAAQALRPAVEAQILFGRR